MKLTKIKSMDVNKSDEKNEVAVAKEAVISLDLTQAGVEADIQANHEAANDALKDRKEAAEEFIKAREEAKKRYGATVAPNSPEIKVNEEDPKLETKGLVEVKPIQESKQVKDRKELATLITEARTKGINYRVSKSLQEGFRYVFESWSDLNGTDLEEEAEAKDNIDKECEVCPDCGKLVCECDKQVQEEICPVCGKDVDEPCEKCKDKMEEDKEDVFSKLFNQDMKIKQETDAPKVQPSQPSQADQSGESNKSDVFGKLFNQDMKIKRDENESLNEASVFDRLIKAAEALPESKCENCDEGCCKEGAEVNESSAFTKLMAAAKGEVTESASDFNKLMAAVKSLPECKLKEGVESLEDAVKDAYEELSADGNEPTVGEILDRVSNNYAGFENICDDPEVCADNYDKVKEILSRIGAQVTEGLTEALGDGDIEYKGFIIHEHQPSDLKNGIAGEYTFELNGEPTYCSFIEDCRNIIDSELENGNGSDNWADLYASYIDEKGADAELTKGEDEVDWHADVTPVDYDNIASEDFPVDDDEVKVEKEDVEESKADFDKLMSAADKLTESEDDEEASDLEAPVEGAEEVNVDVPDTVAEVEAPAEAPVVEDPEIDIDTIDTYEPTGEAEKATFGTIKDAGEGVMYAFKDTLKDLNGLKISLSSLQKLLSDGSGFILDLLGLGPKEDEQEILPEVEAPITINAEQPVEITDAVNTEVADNAEDIPADLLNTNGFEEVEPIDVDEDEVNK